MSTHTYRLVSGQQDDTTGGLPTMAEFIATLNQSVPYANQLPQICGICTNDFNWDDLSVMRLPCYHIFHRDCCLMWMDSTAERRNACPECRTEFCLHNALTAEQEANIRINELEYNEAMSPFNTGAYSWLLNEVDTLYDIQRAEESGRADFVSIIRDARVRWQTNHQPNEFICDEHAEVGNDWIELVIANRVRDMLSADGLTDSWESQAFACVRTRLDDLVNQDVDQMSEAWEQFSQNEQGHEGMDVEYAEDDEDFQQGQYQNQYDDDYHDDGTSEENEDWDSEFNHEDDYLEEGEILGDDVREELLRIPPPASLADPMDGGMNGYPVETRPAAVHRHVREIVSVPGSFRAVGNPTVQTPIRLSEPQPPPEETQSNPPPSTIANSPYHFSSSSSSDTSTDELFPPLSTAERAQLPRLDRAVLQRELGRTYSWILAEGYTVVCEIENMASVTYRGGSTYVVKDHEQRQMAIVRDADAYHMVGWVTVFYRFGGQ